MNESPLRKMSLHFALDIVRFCQYLTARREFILSRQLGRSGTAIGAMVREAGSAESRLDFIHKMGIGQKEASETMYWLEVISSASLAEKPVTDKLISDSRQLYKMITSSILTAKQNQERSGTKKKI